LTDGKNYVGADLLVGPFCENFYLDSYGGGGNLIIYSERGEKMKKILMTMVFICMVGLIGCEDEDMISENKELKAQVNDLKGQVAALEEENAKLKETADYHYQQGVDFQNAGDWNNAKIEFETVINKYPESELVSKAKSKLKETIDKLAEIVFNDAVGLMENEQWTQAKAKLEMLVESYPDSSYVGKAKSKLRTVETELMYVLSTQDEAFQEWKDFRNNEDKYMGDVVTWKLKVRYVSSTSESPICSLYGDYNYDVALLGIEGFTYQASVMLGKLPVVRDDDWLVVTGEFKGISSDAVIMLKPIRVKNLGVQ
jgi:tetratricopeptide (TPR) repeat protein